ncbi:6-phospho-beta-galactosidase [Frankliniella fusca]|uniref:6-phospho-beta-galactosidase n=2 Tax=Arthropoda TaxID=6656 RepID=A0AAE1LKI1_9NEOP|nr:6-phospho-beta-galactosidase [Frankliniella fusca]
MWHFILFTIASILFFAKNPAPIFGKYQVPGPRFWVKYLVFRALLLLRKLRAKPTLDQDGRPVQPLADKECLQVLSSHPLAFDAVFFIAVNMEGIYVIVGSERRQKNIVNGLVYILMPGLGLLRSKKLPDTILFGAKDDAFGAEGIRITPVKALKQWRVQFEGVMHLKDDPSRDFPVKLDGLWSSEWPVFNFDTDLHPHALAKTIATEPWSREYFTALKRAHQTHYEQMGHLKGTLQIGDKEHHLNLMSLRDHSIGEARDWDLMHRYAFFMIFLEDGTMASVGIINQPCTCSTMESGYVYTPEGKNYPLEWCDFKLWQHGEQGTPPTDCAFSFKAGETVYRVKAHVEDFGVHYVGWRWEARMVERFITYEVNGIRGRGVSEFHYHNKSGRQADTTADPEWFPALLKQTYRDRD